MSAKMVPEEEQLTVLLSGEIDHHNSKEIRTQADELILRTHPKRVVLNFREVTFMDSSGIGLIMGRYRLASSYGGSVMVCDASSYLRRVMKVAGLDSIVKICDIGTDKKAITECSTNLREEKQNEMPKSDEA